MEKLKLHTPDLTAQNIERVAQLFPNCVTETQDEQGRLTRAIDFDQLRQELSATIVEGPRERYHLDWPGKREAILAANAPIAKTLRPCREESVDFDTTKNLFIEGDNLDALKLLQETYLGKIKLIYIDPPYNTGKDFVYRDNFTEDSAAYFARSNQKDDLGNRMVANTEANGRFHSDWLNMLYPRLRLARNLLTDDGVILVSIDDHEFANTTRICDEIFGAANSVATLVWEKGRKNDAKLFSVGHEYVLVFAKSLSALRDAKTIWREEKPGAREIWNKYLELTAAYPTSILNVELGLQKWFSELPKSHPSKKWSRYKHVDEHGPWRDGDISWPGGDGPRYDVIHPETKLPCAVPERGWVFSQPETMKRMIELGIVEFRDDHTEPPLRKQHIRPIDFEIEAAAETNDEDIDSEESDEDELATQVRGSYFYKQSQSTVKFVRKLMGAKVFDNPKDHVELARLFDYVTSGDRTSIMLDFFAGGASSAHAIMHLNHSDEGTRRFILVQLPEFLDIEVKAQRAAAKYCDSIGRPRTIAEVAKERIRRASAQVKEGDEALNTNFDTGFRILKIDTSNMREVYYAPDTVVQGDLLEYVDNIRPDRTPEDLLFQVFVDWGIDLALPVSHDTIVGKTVFFVDGNALAACFDSGVTDELVKEIAKRKPLRAVFRDASYGSDSVKINVDQIFRLLSPETEVRSI
jgi:adenine-specific DNA-methyltransferase